MPRKVKCTKQGGTMKDAIRAIFKIVEPGVNNPWYCYECECGKWHVTNNPK